MRSKLSKEMASYIVKIDPKPIDSVYIQVEGKQYHDGETIELNRAPKKITIRRQSAGNCGFTAWRCSYVTITSLDTEKEYYFPVFRKIHSAGLTVEEDSAKLPQEDDSKERKESLRKNKAFRDSNEPTDPPDKSSYSLFHCILLRIVGMFLGSSRASEESGLLRSVYKRSPLDLPRELQFEVLKLITLLHNQLKTIAKTIFRRLWNRCRKWRKVDDIRNVFWFASKKAKYVSQNWRDDAFFGKQVLNGCNPIMIERYSVGKEQKIPLATLEKVYPNIKENIQNGNIYVVDYEILDGIKEDISPTSPSPSRYLAAPIMLLQQMENDLKPIAIQLKQSPGVDNPVFTPEDKYAWLLAKMWVRNSDFYYHELVSHLMRAHILAELFFKASFSLADQHPMARLLRPTGRYTIPINLAARNALISEGGFFDENTAIVGSELKKMLKKTSQQITYESLSLPDNLAHRDVKDLKNYYYRDDAKRIWDAIHSFVHDVVIAIYKDDEEVCQDPELQDMVHFMHYHGFVEKTGCPSVLETREEAIKFITVIMFTCSAEHAAANHGQLDTYTWMPNGPTMRKPPPTNKHVTEEFIMDTLPEIGVTLKGMSVAELLSHVPNDFVPLGQYPEEVVGERHIRDSVKIFQNKLRRIGEEIDKRSKTQEFPYEYLHPSGMENSVTI